MTPTSLALWPSGPLALWPSGPLALWPSGPLALWPSGPLALWPSGPLALWPSGPLALWPSGPLALWPSGPLALWPSGPLDYNTSPFLHPGHRQNLRNHPMQSLDWTQAWRQGVICTLEIWPQLCQVAASTIPLTRSPAGASSPAPCTPAQTRHNMDTGHGLSSAYPEPGL